MPEACLDARCPTRGLFSRIRNAIQSDVEAYKERFERAVDQGVFPVVVFEAIVPVKRSTAWGVEGDLTIEVDLSSDSPRLVLYDTDGVVLNTLPAPRVLGYRAARAQWHRTTGTYGLVEDFPEMSTVPR